MSSDPKSVGNVSLVERDDNAQLRIAPWPGGGIPLPARWRTSRCELRPGWGGEPVIDFVLPPGAKRGRHVSQRVPVGLDPGETYLKLAAVDLDDESSVASFLSDYGYLGVRRLREQQESPFDNVISGYDEIVDKLTPDEVESDEELVQSLQLIDELRPGERPTPLLTLEEQAADEEVDENATPFDEHRNGIETFAEFRAAAGLIQDALALWRFVRGEIGIDDHAWRLYQPPDAKWTEEMLRDLEQVGLTGEGLEMRRRSFELEPIVMLDNILAPALREFSPRVLNRHLVGYAMLQGPYYEMTASPWVDIDLYSLCCAEFFNHIAEHVPYRRCANDRCQRLFVNQEGRAKKGQRRSTGVLYCSASCARAVAQRTYRRRRRERADAPNKVT
jgi:hypothetical protein